MYLWLIVSFRWLSDFLKRFVRKLAVNVLIKETQQAHNGSLLWSQLPMRCSLFVIKKFLKHYPRALMMTLGPLLIIICIALLKIIPLLCTILQACIAFLRLGTALWTQSFVATCFFLSKINWWTICLQWLLLHILPICCIREARLISQHWFHFVFIFSISFTPTVLNLQLFGQRQSL